jgi:phage shock protein A
MPSIFQRISDVISANINDLIDRVEDPERMVKQIIREMEAHISTAKQGVLDAIASEKMLQKDLEHQRRQSEAWGSKAESALRNGKEDLARAALSRKKEHDRIASTLEPAWETARDTSARLKEQLRALEAKLEDARRRRSTLVVRQRAAEARHQMDRTLEHLQAGLEAHTTFGRMEDRVAEIEARTEAMAELHDDASRLERDLRDMALETEVEDELAALKKKLDMPSDS